MSNKQSKYKFHEFKTGFVITAPDRPSVTMKLIENGCGFVITHEEVVKENPDYFDLFDNVDHVVGIPRLHRIIDDIGFNLFLGWTPPEDHEQGELERYSMRGIAIRKWAQTGIRKALAKRIKAQWLRLKEQTNPTVVAVQNRIFSVVLTVPYWMIENEEFYTNRFLISDIMNYRASAGMAGFLPTYDKPLLENWMDWYADTGVAYPALRKTLMNLPPSFPPSLLPSLQGIHLPEVVRDKYKLMAVCILAHRYRQERNAELLPILLRSTEEDIKQVVPLIEEGINYTSKYGPRTVSRFKDALSYTFDYPGELGPIDIIGLAKRSIEYHTNERIRRRVEQRQRVLQGLSEKTPTAIPPIPLPKNKKVKFLATVADVVNEGGEMGHCVAGYAGVAVKGECYLFHVDHEGEQATVEIDKWGRVSQVHGPANSDNGAVKYATRVFRKWGKKFPNSKQSRTFGHAQEIPF